jgi:hypothetical protein
MSVAKKTPGFEVDRRISIGMDVLDDDEKRNVEGILADRASFLASIADPRKVRRITTKEPFYALSIPNDLLIIYSKVGKDIVVEALMHKAVLEQFGEKMPEKAKPSTATNTSRVSNAKKAK